MLKIRILFLTIILFLVLGFRTFTFAQGADAGIAIIKSLDIEPYRAALSGFKDELVKEGQNVKFSEYALDSNMKKEDIAREINTNSFSVIIVVGSGATAFARENFKDKPVVFCMVLNPVASGFVSRMEPGRSDNVTGASMDIPLKKQFEVIKTAIPGAKHIVVFYNPKETQEIVDRAKGSAEGLGLGFQAIQISSEKDMIGSISQLTPNEDVLWALADSKVYTPQNTQFIILETLRKGIPFVGLSPAFVKAGALLSLSCSYRENGQQAAALAVRILKGESPSSLSVTTPEKVEISINANTAKRIKVQAPESIMKEAVNIF